VIIKVSVQTMVVLSNSRSCKSRRLRVRDLDLFSDFSLIRESRSV